MVNRYTVFQPQQYVETYVPLPLEFINQQGAMKQADLDKHRKELESDTDPLSKIGNLSFSLKAYDREGNIVDKSNTELEDYKNSVVNSLYNERNELANDLATGKIDDNEFKRKSKLHINKAATAYNQLASYKDNIEAIKKANEEYAKSKEFGLDPSYGTDMLEYNTEYLNKASKGIYDAYSQQAISDKFDMQKAVLEFKFKDEGGETVSIGEYITKNGWNGVTKERVKAAASQIFNDPNSDVNRNAERVLRHQMRLNPEMFKSNEDIENYYNQLKDNFIQSSILEHAGIVEKADAKNNSLYNQQQRFARQDAQTKAAFEMSLQYVGADPSTSQNDNNMTRIAQSVTGSDNFEFRDGELHYNPVKEGTEYINVFGKNYDAKKAKADGAIEIDGVKFAVTSGPNGQLNVMLPKGDGWEGVNYTIKKAGKNQGLLDDAKKINAIAKRLGYTGGDMKGNQKALESYMMDVYNLESTSTAFPVGLESWLSKEFGTNVDKDGNILNPAQLSNMTLKTADGQLVKGDSNTDEATIKANTLKGARISGFSKSLTNKNIKAGDLEITGNNGMRYILSTGKQNLKDASAASHRLLQSVNDWVMEGKKDHDYSELENNIRGILNVSKDAIHVTTQETAADGLVYTSFVFNNGGKLEKKVLVGDSKGNLVEKDPISLSEAARRMDSAGMLKHLSFYNKDATKRQEKDNSENIITEYEGSEE